MKELSIEDKAKRYDESMDRAKKELSVCGSQDCDAARQIFRLFPELKEGEDEKIRKALFNFFWNQEKRGGSIGVGVSYKDILSWLEKQGEQKPVEKEFTFKAISRLLEMIQPSERAKSYCGKLADTLDKEGYHSDANIVKESIKIMNGEKVPMATMDEQKPVEWRPIDNEYMTKLCEIIDGYDAERQWKGAIKDWLKSLRPQKQWKPSDEQMKSLAWVVEHGNTCQTAKLKDLLEELKAL